MPRPRRVTGEQSAVKSAVRVLELLEFFDRIERAAPVSEIARELGWPQSSTSMLVGSLIDRGYLTSTPDRKIQPTARVPMLGRWVDVWITDGRISQLMRDLGQETGETILLGIPSDIHAVYIDAIPATKPMRLQLPRGTLRPIADSGMGVLLLSGMADDEVARRVARVNAALPPEAPPLKLEEVMAEVRDVREKGFAMSTNRVVSGAGIVCVLLPRAVREQPVGLGIGGLSSGIEENAAEFVALLRAKIAAYLGS